MQCGMATWNRMALLEKEWYGSKGEKIRPSTNSTPRAGSSKQLDLNLHLPKAIRCSADPKALVSGTQVCTAKDTET